MSADYCRFEGHGILKRAFHCGTKPQSNCNTLSNFWVGVRVQERSKQRSENLSFVYFSDFAGRVSVLPRNKCNFLVLRVLFYASTPCTFTSLCAPVPRRIVINCNFSVVAEAFKIKLALKSP